MDRRGQRPPRSDPPRGPTRPDPTPAEGLWARVAALEGRVLKTRTTWLHVGGADDRGLAVRSDPWGPATRLSRRLLEDAAPMVAAGRPLPPRFRGRAARITALLRAAGVAGP